MCQFCLTDKDTNDLTYILGEQSLLERSNICKLADPATASMDKLVTSIISKAVIVWGIRKKQGS